MIRFSLDKIMEDRGLTQKDIVEITGISRNTVKALALNANARIDFPTLDALCKKLHVSPGELIEFIPEEDEILTDVDERAGDLVRILDQASVTLKMKGKTSAADR